MSGTITFEGTIIAEQIIPSSGVFRPLANGTNALNFAQADGTAFVILDTTISGLESTNHFQKFHYTCRNRHCRKV